MAFRIHDVTVHLMANGAPGACTCGPASPGPGQERPGCGAASDPKPGGPKLPAKPKPKGTGTPKPAGGDKDKRKALAFLRDQLRDALAPPTA